MRTMWSCTTRNSQTKKQLDHDEKGISWTDVIFTCHNLAKSLLSPRDPGSGSRPTWSQRQPGMPFHLWTRASWPALQCLPHPGKRKCFVFDRKKKNLGKRYLAISTIVHLMGLAIKSCSKGVQRGEGGFQDVFPLILFSSPQLVTLLSLKFRGVRQNYREALYIGFAMGLNTTVWVFWVLTGFVVPDPYRCRHVTNREHRVIKSLTTLSGTFAPLPAS